MKINKYIGWEKGVDSFFGYSDDYADFRHISFDIPKCVVDYIFHNI